MSPLNAMKIGRRRAGLAACLFGLILAAPAWAVARGAHALRGRDVKRAEKVLVKLRLLYGAADAADAATYRRLASKFYPGLFVTVAKMRQSDLSTDLSTAVFLAEELGRTWAGGGQAAADCASERPDIYLRLCLDLGGGTRRQLLLAKSRLHARWAGAVASRYRGECDAEITHALSEMAAARAFDTLIAARVIEIMMPLKEVIRHSEADADPTERLAATGVVFDVSDEGFARALHAAGALLAWMPRSPSFYRLSGARAAYADGMAWHGKARLSKRKVIAANSFAPDPLKVLGLDAEQADAAAGANWKSAARLARLAEQSLPEAAR